MRLNSWLAFLKSLVLRGRAARRRPAPARLSVEILEARALPSVSFQPAGNYSTGGYNTATVASGDFNHDGKTDVATVNTGNSAVAVLLGRGDGTFAAPVTYPLGTESLAAEAGDFNGDGNLDLVVADRSGNAVRVLSGRGDGTFGAPVSYAVSSPLCLAVADFNGDGKTDLAVSSQSNNTVSVLLNNGAGGFRAPVSYAVGASPIGTEVGDFNGDGKTDIVTANGGGASVSVLLNNGSGGFLPAINSAAGGAYGYSPFDVAVGDFNGDGKTDLAAVNSSGGTFLSGNGDGTFAPGASFWTSFGAESVAVGDFNRDGKADLALGFENPYYLYTVYDWSYDPWGEGGPYPLYDVYETDVGVSVLEGGGDGTFVSETDVTTNWYVNNYYPVSDPVDAVAVADFDRNGFPDITAIESNGSADVVINTQPSAGLQMDVSPNSATAGAARSVTVSATDLAGNPDPNYTGTVRFTSSDPQADLPADYTFTAADHGVHTFSVILKTAGDQSLTVGDDTHFAFASADLTVTPAAVSTLNVIANTTLNSGAVGYITFSARDAYGNVATDYSGTVRFTSSDPAATLPDDYTFSPDADGGFYYFTYTPRTIGVQTFTVTDMHTPGLTAQFTLGVLPVASITGPAVSTINQPLTFTLSANGPAGSVYTFALDWNRDGVTDQTVTGVSGTTVTHSFGTSGINTVYMKASLNGVTSDLAWASVNILPISVQVAADPADPTRQALFVTGTAGNDTIILGPGPATAWTSATTAPTSEAWRRRGACPSPT
jgi:hypothetical protein